MSTLSTVKVNKLFVAFQLPAFAKAMAALKAVVPFDTITSASAAVLDFKKQHATEELTEVAVINFEISNRPNRIIVTYAKSLNAFGVDLHADSVFSLPASEGLVVDDNKAFLQVSA